MRLTYDQSAGSPKTEYVKRCRTTIIDALEFCGESYRLHDKADDLGSVNKAEFASSPKPMASKRARSAATQVPPQPDLPAG